jgi:peptide/nickel transport system substrate-binding protein
MRSGPKRLTGLIAVAVSALLAAACSTSSTKAPTGTGDFSDCDKNPNTCNSGTRAAGGTLIAISEKTFPGWNSLDANSSTFDLAQVESGLIPTPYIVTPDFKLIPNKDLVDSIDKTSDNPLTIVYKVKPTAVWNDGTPINADDFTWAWKTEDGVAADCDPKKCTPASTSGYNLIQSIVGSGTNNQTVTVTFSKPYADWQGLFGLLPAKTAATAAGPDLGDQWIWFNNTVPTWSGGPMQIPADGYQKDASVTLVPNPKWYGAVKPTLDKVVYKIITDQTAEVPALQNGEVNYLYSQPNADLVSQVQGLPNVKSRIGHGFIWEHVDINLKNAAYGGSDAAHTALRTGIFQAINRQAIIDKTVGVFDKSAKPLNNHMFIEGQPGYADHVTATGQGSGDSTKALATLSAAGYKFDGKTLKDPSGVALPHIKFVYTVGNKARQSSAELIQADLAKIGITVDITPTQDLGGSLQNGLYDMIIFAWVGGPLPTSGAYQLWTVVGGGDYNSYDDPTATKDLTDAAATPDPVAAAALLDDAEKLLTNAAVVLPLYQKPTFIAVSSNVVGVRDNATNAGPAYNVQEWGLTTTAN